MAETRNLVIERTFDAPIEKVWAAWTEPEHIAKWWGPKNFTSHDNRIDLRVGGKNILVMHGPVGTEWDYDMYSGGTYKEIVEHKKIVVTDSFMDKDGNVVSPEKYGMSGDFPKELLVTIEFESLPDGKTHLKVTHQGMPAGEGADQAEAGWNESLDKLEKSLQ